MGCGKKLTVLQVEKLQKQLEFPVKFTKLMKTKMSQRISQILAICNIP